MFDKIGNAKADELAVAASENRDFSPDLLRAAEDHLHFTKSLHQEMTSVLSEWSLTVKEVDFLYNKNLSPPPLPP